MKIITRKQAKEQGLKRYYTGQPCKHNHISERSTKNGSCLECCRINANSKRSENKELARTKDRDSYRRNIDARRKALRDWRKNNKDKANAQCQRYRDKNRDKIRTYNRALSKLRNKKDPLVAARKRDYQSRNKDYYSMKSNERRALKLMAVPKWYNKTKVNELYSKAKEMGLTVDHIVPLKSNLVCGLHCWHNLQLLDQSENSSKGNYHWPDMP